MTKRLPIWAGVVILAAAGSLACGGAARLTEVERVKSGGLEIVLLSTGDALRQGRGTFTIEFHSASDGRLVDVGSLKASANMAMPGMPMFAAIDVQPSALKGRYAATSDFSMAGRWRISLEWDGPAGPGSVSFSGTVQ